MFIKRLSPEFESDMVLLTQPSTHTGASDIKVHWVIMANLSPVIYATGQRPWNTRQNGRRSFDLTQFSNEGVRCMVEILYMEEPNYILSYIDEALIIIDYLQIKFKIKKYMNQLVSHLDFADILALQKSSTRKIIEFLWDYSTEKINDIDSRQGYLIQLHADPENIYTYLHDIMQIPEHVWVKPNMGTIIQNALTLTCLMYELGIGETSRTITCMQVIYSKYATRIPSILSIESIFSPCAGGLKLMDERSTRNFKILLKWLRENINKKSTDTQV